jgi:hypothetical protein
LRFVRSVVGLLLALIGLLVTGVAAVAAFWVVGPDNTVHAGEQQLTSKGLAVITTPGLLDRHGPTLHVAARSADGKRPLFVGIARDLDVASYLDGVQQTKLVQVQFPVKLTTQEVKGAAAALPAPAAFDWWIAKASGLGDQSLEWPIADGPYDVVIMNADGKPAPDVKVDFGIELGGAFVTCLLVLLAGLLLLAGGILLMFFRRHPAGSIPVGPATAPWQSGPADSPSVPQQSGLRRTAGVLSLGTVALMASGCVAVPEHNTVDSLTRPAISPEPGQAVIKRYNTVNDTANQRRDEKLIETIEGGSLLEQSRAGYQVSRALDKGGKNLTKPFAYTKPVFASPNYGSYPMRFVSTAGMSTNPKVRHLGVWERTSAASPWLLTYAVYPSAATKLPDLAGLRVPTAADTAKLAAPPKTAATDLAQFLTGGTGSPKATRFVATPQITALIKANAKKKAQDAAQSTVYRKVSDSFGVTAEPVAFITSSGEALVFVTLTEDYLLELAANVQAWWSTGDSTAFSHNIKYRSALTHSTVHQVALAVPAKGKGKIRILSSNWQIVNAGGY